MRKSYLCIKTNSAGTVTYVMVVTNKSELVDHIGSEKGWAVYEVNSGDRIVP